MQVLTVNGNDAGQRLDKFLSKAIKGLPMSLMYKYIRTKKIKVNRKRTVQNYMLVEGDTIELFIRDEFFDSPESDTGAVERIIPKLDIVYEDENIILCNKRAGVLVHEDDSAKENTLIMHIQAYLYQKGEYNPESEQSFAPALCNRIDRNTGGIVIAAKNAEALREMNSKIKNGEIRKFYICAVSGRMRCESETLNAYLKKDSANNTVKISDTPQKDYKPISTRYRVICEKNNESLLEVELLTGRTHQIRAHMAHIGHPLLGDGKYGINKAEKSRGYKYQALYSYRLIFNFHNSDGALGYLKGKQISIKPNQIWFISNYPDADKKISKIIRESKT